MGKEIERRFLLEKDFKFPPGVKPLLITQFYLWVHPDKVARVRFVGTPPSWRPADTSKFLPLDWITNRTKKYRGVVRSAILTIKAAGPNALVRIEHEFTIPVKKALDLMEVKEGHFIHKQRYRVPTDAKNPSLYDCSALGWADKRLEEAKPHWEIDKFQEKNQGLVIAELEFSSEVEAIKFKPPSWVGKEITKDHRYSNACLSITPFIEWL